MKLGWVAVVAVSQVSSTSNERRECLMTFLFPPREDENMFFFVYVSVFARAVRALFPRGGERCGEIKGNWAWGCCFLAPWVNLTSDGGGALILRDFVSHEMLDLKISNKKLIMFLF